MKSPRLAAVALLVILAGVLMPFASSPVYAEEPGDSKFQILPDCDPAKFVKDGESTKDGDKGACGFNAFQRLVVNVIKYLLYIMVPIAFCIVGWAGFKILTSAGNSEKIHEAYGMIKIVVIGILIAVLSYIIIVNIFNVLNVKVNVVPIS